jgi:hypothetical protein
MAFRWTAAVRRSIVAATMMGAAGLGSSLPVSAQALVFHADFSRWSGPPLIKTKFGVYETPFLKKADLQRAAALLTEAGARDLRYEMGWGKPDTYAFDQITGTPTEPKIDFTRLDPFISLLHREDVTPLFAMTYDPLPLKTGTDWQRWKDVPSNLKTWQQINADYARHYRALGLQSPFYEMWNEPDLPGDGGKVFFNGEPADYRRVCAAGTQGIHTGDPEASVGGPVIAYDLRYAAPLINLPINFVSIHAYNNYAGQIDGMRRLVAARPELPILLTEYASFTSYGPTAPVSRYPAAERFFQDVQGLLNYTDVPKVYWAQWVDDSIGMITRNWHRKALFNAYKIYQTLLPVDRSPVSPDGKEGVGLMAASDAYTAAVVAWNENTAPRTVTIALDKLPFQSGTLRLYRIDATHASYGDDPASENLSVNGFWKFTTSQVNWTGSIPAESVVFLRATDQHASAPQAQPSLGAYIRRDLWYPNRLSGAYADFDLHTGIARVGLGTSAVDTAQMGIVLDRPSQKLRVLVKKSGPFSPQDANALFGLRIDYGSRQGGYARSVLWHDGSYQVRRQSVLPWGKGKATVDVAHRQPGIDTGVPFTINIVKDAPKSWDGRIILTPILQDMGADSDARITLKPL